jgi:hypothetical protein
MMDDELQELPLDRQQKAGGTTGDPAVAVVFTAMRVGHTYLEPADGVENRVESLLQRRMILTVAERSGLAQLGKVGGIAGRLGGVGDHRRERLSV